MKFSKGDLRTFAEAIVLDLIEAGLPIEGPHKWTPTVYESLLTMLPNDTDARKESDHD